MMMNNKMKHIKIFAITFVMILLVLNISFGKDTTSSTFDTRNPQNTRYYYDDEFHSEKPSRGGYYEITRDNDNNEWDVVQYNTQGQATNSYSSTQDSPPSPTKPGEWTQTGRYFDARDLNGDKDTTDPGEAAGLYSFVDPVRGSAGGYFDRQNNYYDSGRNLQGRSYDPKTGTYIPKNNDDIRVDPDGNVFVDMNGDGQVNINDIDTNRDGKVDSDERARATISSNYNPDTGTFTHDNDPNIIFSDDGEINVYGEEFEDTVLYQGGSFSFEDVDGIDRHMVLADGTVVTDPATGLMADVSPDTFGGYYIDTTHFGGYDLGGTLPRDDTTTIHYVAQSDDNNDGYPDSYLGVVDRAGSDIVFNPDNPSQTFTIESDVVVVDPDDPTNPHIVVQGTDGTLYVIDGNDDLNDLLEGRGRVLDPESDEYEEYFGGGPMGTFQVYRFGTQLDDLAEVAEGYPGFSMFYDEDEYNDWTGLLDDEFVRTLFGGMDSWADAFCEERTSDVGGSNVATGAEPGSAAAYVSAEEYQIPDPTDPSNTQYLYMIEFYVYAGESPAGYPNVGCTDLHFQILRQGVSLFDNNVTGAAYTWELEEGDAITYTADAMWFGTGTATHVGENICIKFTTMVPNGCIPGLSEGDDLCDAITIAAEETYDFDCEGWYCSEFIGFLTGVPGRDGWSFELDDEDTDDAEAGSPTPSGDTTDPDSGQPVLNLG